MDSDAVQLLTKALSIGLMWSRVAHALSDCEHLDTQSVCCHRAIIVSRINLHVFMCVVRLRRQILDDLSNECEDSIASQEIWAATPQSSALYECMKYFITGFVACQAGGPADDRDRRIAETRERGRTFRLRQF